VWRLPPGDVQVQKVLQYPVCVVVISPTYARFHGVVTGLSSVELSGHGWAVGTMLRPAAGRVLWEASVSELTDRHVDVASVPGLAGGDLPARVRDVMEAHPSDASAHARAIGLVEDALTGHLPVDEEGHLVNAIVDRVESDVALTRVDDLATAFGVSARQLQRLTRERLGLTPKWLIQRRRLHDATLRLKRGVARLGDVAHELGYSDQAHFTRDFSRVTGMPPGDYLAHQ
jgi:AraC-like DNA-binding protein